VIFTLTGKKHIRQEDFFKELVRYCTRHFLF
jgi:hypothetical protein